MDKNGDQEQHLMDRNDYIQDYTQQERNTNMRYCQYCGMPMEDDDLFCTRCGKAAKGIQKETQDRESSRGTGRGPAEGKAVRMGYVSAGSGAGKPAGKEDPGRQGNSSGSSNTSDYEVYDEYDEYEEEEMGRKRMILIISCLAIVVVVGVLVGLLLTTPGRRGSDPAQQAAVSEDGSGEQEENLVSEQENKTAEADDAGKDTAIRDGQTGEGTKDSTENDSQKSSEKESSEEESSQQGRESDEAADRGNEENTALEKEEKDQEESREPAVVKTEQNEETAEGIEELEKKDQEDQENKEALDSSYILADSNSRLYSREELERMDNYTLQMAINEIYARHGRKFKTDSIREYFEGKSWYTGTIEPEAFDGNEGNYFNDYESANRELMARIRASREEKTTSSEKKEKTNKND